MVAVVVVWFCELCEVFGGENLGVGCGEKGCGFIVSLIRPFSGGTRFSCGDCKRAVAGFRESGGWRG